MSVAAAWRASNSLPLRTQKPPASAPHPPASASLSLSVSLSVCPPPPFCPQVDLAPTLAFLLGVPVPFGSVGRVWRPLWELASAADDDRSEADRSADRSAAGSGEGGKGGEGGGEGVAGGTGGGSGGGTREGHASCGAEERVPTDIEKDLETDIEKDIEGQSLGDGECSTRPVLGAGAGAGACASASELTRTQTSEADGGEGEGGGVRGGSPFERVLSVNAAQVHRYLSAYHAAAPFPSADWAALSAAYSRFQRASATSAAAGDARSADDGSRADSGPEFVEGSVEGSVEAAAGAFLSAASALVREQWTQFGLVSMAAGLACLVLCFGCAPTCTRLRTRLRTHDCTNKQPCLLWRLCLLGRPLLKCSIPRSAAPADFSTSPNGYPQGADGRDSPRLCGSADFPER